MRNSFKLEHPLSESDFTLYGVLLFTPDGKCRIQMLVLHTPVTLINYSHVHSFSWFLERHWKISIRVVLNSKASSRFALKYLSQCLVHTLCFCLMHSQILRSASQLRDLKVEIQPCHFLDGTFEMCTEYWRLRSKYK